MKRRLAYVLLVVLVQLVIHAQQPATALDSLISIDFKNETLINCIQKLESKTHQRFTYSTGDLNEQKISICFC